MVPKARKGSEVNITANAESVASSQSRSTERNIYDVLQQYLMLTGRMIAEARAVRIPLLERDRQLLISGAMKNTRNVGKNSKILHFDGIYSCFYKRSLIFRRNIWPCGDSV